MDLVGGFWMAVAAAMVVMMGVTIHESTFGQRCTKAGYSGAQHEACVIRLSEGGPVYIENK